MSAAEPSAAPPTLTPEELARVILHANLLKALCADWDALVEKGNDQQAADVFADRMEAASKMIRGEPAPSASFHDLSTRKRQWTEEECRAMVNGALLVLVSKSPGERLRLSTEQILAAHQRLGTLALALSDDDKMLTITGLKRQ